jgi:hypothetical protein
MTSVDPNDSIISKFSAIFGAQKKTSDDTLSLLRARSLRLFTKSQMPIISGDHIIAKTPQLIESSDEVLRLITAKKAAEI